MTAQKMKNSFVLLVALAGFVVSPFKEQAQAAETITRGWVGEGALGFIANTPDDTAFALNLNFDRFITDHLSTGATWLYRGHGPDRSFGSRKILVRPNFWDPSFEDGTTRRYRICEHGFSQ